LTARASRMSMPKQPDGRRRFPVGGVLKGGLVFALAGAAAASVLMASLAWSSRRPVEVGLIDGRLRKCPETPNCIGSEQQNRAHAVESFPIEPLEPFAAWRVFQRAVEVTGGKLVHADAGYLHAEYRTSVFRFIDDFEARLDVVDGRIHVRSASRVGRSDLGVNRHRLQRLRAVYRKLMNGGLTRAEVQ
jgi:uncharacterized protein (DUF1499 family)